MEFKVNNIYKSQKSIILPKEIYEVQYSNKVDYATFSRVLRCNKVVTSIMRNKQINLHKRIVRDNVENY